MKKRTSLLLILLLSCSGLSFGQTPAPSTTTPQQERTTDNNDDDDVVRITTNLVQVDAVVTDKNGKLVTDLQPEEIELYEDGRRQKITNFSFVSTESGTEQPAVLNAPADKTAPIPPVRLRPEQVRRTVALVVDDLGLSFESMHFVREALRKFVDNQVQPGDLVAIIRTAGGMGALQQFTSDKRQLYAMIDRVKWSLNGRGGIWAFAPLEGSVMTAQTGGGKSAGQDDVGIVGGDDDDAFREDLFSAGTLGAVNYVVRGMRELPGRKSILLMSDGISISYRGDPARRARMVERLRRLTDLANRASVVIYTMDARGLPAFGLTAADDTAGLNPTEIDTRMQQRRDSFFDSQGGLNYLAAHTGGFFIRNDNDLSAGIRRVLDDQKGYYLIGYRPDDSTFDAKTGRRQFHQISLKLKRSGLKHRMRTGFYGFTEEQSVARRQTRVEQLNNALVSPFTSGGVNLRLTSLFGNDSKAGSFVRSMLHIEARDLTFTEEPDGWHKAVFDVMAVTFGDNGVVVDAVNRIQTVRVRGATYKRILENGFVYSLTVPVKKPGAYQLRAALRDTATERIGSASQFIDVPNIGENRLALSGLAVLGSDPSAKPGANGKEAASAEANAPAASVGGDEEEITDIDPQASPAVRRFRRGMVMNYGYVIYNAQVDKATGQPRLQTQMRLFRDGKEIFAGRVQPFDPSGQTDLKRLTAGAALQLATDMSPGEYILQIIVTDTLAKKKYRAASQWIDFEIVK
jgi:VWFA-related protein